MLEGTGMDISPLVEIEKSQLNLSPGDPEEVSERAQVKGGVYWAMPITAEEVAQEKPGRSPSQQIWRQRNAGKTSLACSCPLMKGHLTFVKVEFVVL